MKNRCGGSVKGRSTGKGRLAAIISVAAAALAICALLIANIFFPLKYFTAYLVSGSRSAEGDLGMHVLDVGQADCAIVCLPDGRSIFIYVCECT